MAKSEQSKEPLLEKKEGSNQHKESQQDIKNTAASDDNAAEPLEQQEASDTSFVQYCVFKSGNEEYAIPIEIVKEVVKYSNAAPIPQMPNYIIGMSNIRGNIYGVMDLKTFFQGEGNQADYNYLLVLDHDVYKMAIVIPNVPDSLMVSVKEIEELNSTSLKSVLGQKYLKGIIKRDSRMIILFDILALVSGEKFTVVGD